MKHPAFSIVIELSGAGSRDAWFKTIESFKQQTLPTECFELLLTGSERHCRRCDGAPLTFKSVICSGSTFRRKEAALRQSQSSLILFIEEPVGVPRDFLEIMAGIMKDSAVVAVQPRIEARGGAQPGQFPVRAGMKRIFQVPFLDGRISLIRKEALLSAGGLSPLPRLALWMDLSWRMMKTTGFIRTTELTEVSLLSDTRPLAVLGAALSEGVSRAFFVARWRTFLLSRWKRILVRIRELWRQRLSTLGGQMNCQSLLTILAGAGIGLFRDSMAILAFVPALLFVRRVQLPESGIIPIYSGAFMYADDCCACVTRVSIFNPVGLLDRHYELMRTLLEERLFDLKSDALRTRFGSMDIAALQKLDVLRLGDQ